MVMVMVMVMMGSALIARTTTISLGGAARWRRRSLQQGPRKAPGTGARGSRAQAGTRHVPRLTRITLALSLALKLGWPGSSECKFLRRVRIGLLLLASQELTSW